MRNATPVLPFKMRRPTHHHYFLRVNFRPFSFFMRTTRAKIIPEYGNRQANGQVKNIVPLVLVWPGGDVKTHLYVSFNTRFTVKCLHGNCSPPYLHLATSEM